MRSKPDPVDQPERTAHYDCHQWADCLEIEISCGSDTCDLKPGFHYQSSLPELTAREFGL